MLPAMPFLVILSRWVHVISACLAIGGLFFFRFILPRALQGLDETASGQAFLACRRTFKILIHTVILLLILTGIYNTCLAWDKYKLDEAVLHSLWGTHLLLAALAMVILLYVLAGKQPPPSHRRLMGVGFLILLLTVAASSSLKWARERVVAQQSVENPPIENPLAP
jgi:uncharacterized membrane protein